MSTLSSSPRVTRSTATLKMTENYKDPNLPTVDNKTGSSGSDDEDTDQENDRRLKKLEKSPYLLNALKKHEYQRPIWYAEESAPKSSPLLTPLNRPPLPTRHTEEAKKPDGINIVVVVIVVLIAIMLAAGYIMYCRQPVSAFPSEAPTTSFDMRFEKQLAKLKGNFFNQSPKTWRTIRATVLPAGLDPRSPGVLAVLGTEQALETAACIAAALAHAIMVSFNDTGYVRLNGANYRDRQNDAAGVKKEMDGVIQSSLGSDMGQQHVVLVERVDLLPAKSGLLFHGLCDNEFAPFKHAVYIFTSRLGDRSATSKVVDMQVTGAWEGHLEEDKRSSIESRIGNHIVNIVPEPKDALLSMCR